MRKLVALLAMAALNLVATTSQAETFNATLPDAIGPMRGMNGLNSQYVISSLDAPGASAAGAATLTFDLIGYGGIDGFGPRINNNDVWDDFSFRTGDTFFGVALNMGGANPGAPTFFDTYPYVSLLSYTDNGAGKGGLAKFQVAFTLLSGNNTFIFQYGCCSAANGVEEGWGLSNVKVTAELLPAVPEPETYAMMLAGLGLVGMAAKRRKPLKA